MTSKYPPESVSHDNTPQSGGLKRRDLLLSGSSLAALSALSAVGLTGSAQAQQPPRPPQPIPAQPAQAQAQQPAPAPSGQRPNIVVIMGDDIGIW